MRGEVLDLIRISRTEMGAYLCIARNGVQPAVSKRIILNVDCKYHMHVGIIYLSFSAYFIEKLYGIFFGFLNLNKIFSLEKEVKNVNLARDFFKVDGTAVAEF